MNRKTTRMLSAGLVAGGLLTALGVAQPAVAYPPGIGMTITGNGSAATKPSVVTINVSQAQPGCRITVNAVAGNKKASSTSVVGPNGTASFSLSLAGASGKTLISSRTFGCTTPEKASTIIYTTTPRVKAPATVSAEKPFVATATNFAPGASVTFIARKGNMKVTSTTTASSSGFARTKLTLPAPGTWVLVAVSNGKSVSTTVKVS